MLMERIAAKDQQAMAQLFDRHSRLVYSIAFRVLHNSGESEDVMQEIFFQLWKAPGSFVAGRSSLPAWLAVVARNRAVDALRRRKPSDPVDDVVLAAPVNLASEVECNAMMEKVRAVLQGLPTAQQKSVEMAFFEGLTHSEIAEQTGDPVGTVKTRIRSALTSLRKAVQA
jgi:RNA polymerase sigma-70 factor (ECF subfamily)